MGQAPDRLRNYINTLHRSLSASLRSSRVNLLPLSDCDTVKNSALSNCKIRTSLRDLVADGADGQPTNLRMYKIDWERRPYLPFCLHDGIKYGHLGSLLLQKTSPSPLQKSQHTPV